MDDLEDVVIDSRQRISDDPSDWILPKSLVKSGNLYEWWSGLRAADDALAASGITKRQRELLTWLASEYEVLRNQHGPEDHELIPQHLSKVRTVLRHICHLGLTTEQAARLVGETRATVFRALFFNKPIPDDQLEVRFTCEAMLRQQVPQKNIVAELPMTVEEVRGLAKMLGIERVTTNDGFGDAIRNEAVELRRQGWTNPQIAAHLSDKHQQTVRPATVSQWWRRATVGAA